MTSENNYAILIASLSDWVKHLVPVFQPMRSNTKTNRTLHASFSPTLVVGDCLKFWLVHHTVCFCYGIGFSTVIWKPLHQLTLLIAAVCVNKSKTHLLHFLPWLTLTVCSTFGRNTLEKFKFLKSGSWNEIFVIWMLQLLNITNWTFLVRQHFFWSKINFLLLNLSDTFLLLCSS